MELAEFVSRYEPRPPRKRPGPADAARVLGHDDGVLQMPCIEDMAVGAQPGGPEGSHLWVITPAGIPVLLEMAPDVQPPPLESGVAKHTNLTGGTEACCGGEVWVDPVLENSLYLHGGSGRYPVRSPSQLQDAAEVFAGFGYAVTTAGWDTEVDQPSRVFRQ